MRIVAAGLCAAALGCGADPPSAASAPLEIPVGHPPAEAPPANVVGGFSIQLPAETLAPGEERLPCWVFPLDLSGPSHMVGGGKLTPTPGLHHGNITTRWKRGEGIRPCEKETAPFGGEANDVFEGGSVLFGSSTQVTHEEWQSFPAGMAFRIGDGVEIVARMHYLNTTDRPLVVAPRYEWFTVDKSTVTTELGPFIWRQTEIDIPPASEWTVSATCRFPAPMHLVHVLPHMHRMGTAFRAAYVGGPFDGRDFLESDGYDPDRGVMLEYEPAVELPEGGGASFSCTWRNPTTRTVHEGVGDDEMCMLFGYAYPPESAITAIASSKGCLYVAPP